MQSTDTFMLLAILSYTISVFCCPSHRSAVIGRLKWSTQIGVGINPRVLTSMRYFCRINFNKTCYFSEAFLDNSAR